MIKTDIFNKTERVAKHKTKDKSMSSNIALALRHYIKIIRKVLSKNYKKNACAFKLPVCQRYFPRKMKQTFILLDYRQIKRQNSRFLSLYSILTINLPSLMFEANPLEISYHYLYTALPPGVPDFGVDFTFFFNYLSAQSFSFCVVYCLSYNICLFSRDGPWYYRQTV